MRAAILLLLIGSINSPLGAQNFASQNPDYIKNVGLGEEALNKQEYDSCMAYYKMAFKIQQTSYLSTMRAAACAFSANEIEYMSLQLDTAFALSWSGAHQVFINFAEFKYLLQTPFAEMVNQRYERAAEEAGVNLALMKEMDVIRYEDQRYRRAMEPVADLHGWDSPQMDSLWKLQGRADSLNTQRISELIDEMGYPGRSMVGDRHASTAFLVIQHADQDVQEKYLPIITAAADAGEVDWSSVALLIDRVNLRQGKKQIYGSQVSRDTETNEHFFSAIENPHQVDSLRASVGLGPIQAYGDNWDIKWDPEKHLRRHAEIERTKKE